jgi:hypothetical protein
VGALGDGHGRQPSCGSRSIWSPRAAAPGRPMAAGSCLNRPGMATPRSTPSLGWQRASPANPQHGRRSESGLVARWGADRLQLGAGRQRRAVCDGGRRQPTRPAHRAPPPTGIPPGRPTAASSRSTRRAIGTASCTCSSSPTVGSPASPRTRRRIRAALVPGRSANRVSGCARENYDVRWSSSRAVAATGSPRALSTMGNMNGRAPDGSSSSRAAAARRPSGP